MWTPQLDGTSIAPLLSVLLPKLLFLTHSTQILCSFHWTSLEVWQLISSFLLPLYLMNCRSNIWLFTFLSSLASIYCLLGRPYNFVFLQLQIPSAFWLCCKCPLNARSFDFFCIYTNLRDGFGRLWELEQTISFSGPQYFRYILVRFKVGAEWDNKWSM